MSATTAEETTTETEQTSTGVAGSESTTATQTAPEGKVFTQAQIDKMVSDAVARGKVSGETAVKQYLEQQAQSAEDQAKTAAQQAQQERDDARKEAVTARVEVALERALDAAKVPASNRAAALRLADLDLDALAPDGKVDADAIKALAESTVTANPFLAGTGTTTTTATGADLSGGTTGSKSWTRAEIDKLTPEEFTKHEAEIMAQMQAGKIQ